MSNRVFPKFDSSYLADALEIPRGPIMHTGLKNDSGAAFVSAVLPCDPTDNIPHMLTLQADRVDVGMYLHSMSYIDNTGGTKLKLFADNGQVRICLRLGGKGSQEARVVTLEQLEAFMSTVHPDNAKGTV